MADAKILVISGTNRPGANALKVAALVLEQYQQLGIPAGLLSLAQLPQEIFDSSSYATQPASFAPLQAQVLAAAGLHLICPEYNGSFPGVLKYFIDMLRFPQSLERRPVALVGEAAGLFGALRSVEQLQVILGYRNAYLYPQRVFIPDVRRQLDAAGRLVDPEMQKRLAEQVRGFGDFVRALRAGGMLPVSS